MSDSSLENHPHRVAPLHGGVATMPMTIPRPVKLGTDDATLAHLLDDEACRVVCGGEQWRLNEMSGAVTMGGIAVSDQDVFAIQAQLSRISSVEGKMGKTFSTGRVRAALDALAARRPYHPVREYLNRLEVPAENPLPGLFGAVGVADAEKRGLEQEMIRRWLIGAVARVFVPGCKMDTVLVLHGRMGARKSSFFEALGGEWHTATSAEFGSREAIDVLRGAWIGELDEMDSVLRARDHSIVKAFVTRRTDRYTRKYERVAQDLKRTSVFCGTTNEAVLSDPAGSRRWWVVGVEKIELDWVLANRDLVWGWAVGQYRRNEKWWLEDAEEVYREATVGVEFAVEQPWHQLVQEWLETNAYKQQTSTTELLEEALGVPKEKMTSGHARTVAGIMRRLGWRAHKTSSVRLWVKDSGGQIQANDVRHSGF